MWERGTVRGLRWIRWEGDELGRWEIFDFIQGWEMQSESKISPFFYVNRGNKEGQDCFEIFCVAPSYITASVTKSLWPMLFTVTNFFLSHVHSSIL